MAYAELHCVSNFTFLRGASHPQELVRTASALGYRALAITDECSLAGVVKAHVAALECDLQLIIGSEFSLEGQRLVALVSNSRILCRALSTYHSSPPTQQQRRVQTGMGRPQQQPTQYLINLAAQWRY